MMELLTQYDSLSGNGKFVKVAKILKRRPYDIRYRYFRVRLNYSDSSGW
jgi:hypothetical protein